MIKQPEPGLYRTTKPYPGQEEAIPAGVLVYVGVEDGVAFVVRPGQNRRNRWFWGKPTYVLRSVSWAESLKRLPSEGFYTLPHDLTLDGGGRWLENAIVQLGYNGEGRGILFVAEDHDGEPRNVLVFSDRGVLVSDELLAKLVWAPILPVRPGASS
ncbi:hypothetical protein [Polyangium jinanense]|uniref:Uncharacterized protein n=1 Tax=Polyangium jinanense TaxID=2829994 RepID=A0A9X3XA60_9BACT|nr:hypothetical protein [Polyangium jinanense]MDC3958806.1 hypothetical protein [Polyangium jinanense]MDC3985213.1 hypothetical protein [Polyangium jinanense]